MIGAGFAAATTEALWVIRGNLLRGLGRVGESLQAGTFERVGPKGEAPPAQSGLLTLGLLVRLDEELAHRMDRGVA